MMLWKYNITILIFILLSTFITYINAQNNLPIFTNYKLSPKPRSSAFIDIYEDVAIMYGGVDAIVQPVNDVYIWDLYTLTWHYVETKGNKPIATASPCVALFKEHKMLLVTGGVYDNYKLVDEVYLLNLTTWEWSIAPINMTDAPSGRQGASCLVLNNTSTLFMHGGKPFGSVVSDDLWLLDVNTWKWQKQDVGNTLESMSMSMIQYGNSILGYGGYRGHAQGKEIFEVKFIHELNLTNSSWTKYTIIGEEDQFAGENHGSQLFVKDDILYILGGYGSNSVAPFPYYFRRINITNWKALNASDFLSQENDIRRGSTQGVLYKNEIIAWGGIAYGNSDASDIGTIIFNTITQTWRNPPSLRVIGGRTMPKLYDMCSVEYKNRYLIVVGGETEAADIQNDTYAYDARYNTWQRIETNGFFKGVFKAACVRYNERLIVYGGQHRNGEGTIVDLNDVQILDLNTFTWLNVSNIMKENNAIKSKEHACALRNEEHAMYCFGGANTDNLFFTHLRRLNIKDPNLYVWDLDIVTTGDNPPGIRDLQLHIYNNLLFVHFGYAEGHFVNDEAFTLNLDTFIWSKSKLPATISTRRRCLSTTFGSYTVYYGAQLTFEGQSDLTIFDMEFQSWTKLSYTGNEHPGIANGIMAKIGPSLVMFGGRKNYDYTNQTTLLYVGIFDMEVNNIIGDDIQCSTNVYACSTVARAVRIWETIQSESSVYPILDNVRFLLTIDDTTTQYIHNIEKKIDITRPITVQTNNKNNMLRVQCFNGCFNVKVSSQTSAKAFITRNIQYEGLGVLYSPTNSAFTIDGSILYAINSNFINHYAKDGSVATIRLGNATFINCMMMNNSAINDGGAINSYIGGINIQNLTIVNGNKAFNGGFLYAIFSDINITSSSVNDNRATQNGGALFLIYSSITIQNSSLNNNHVIYSNESTDLPSYNILDFSAINIYKGGAISFVSSNGYLLNSMINNNNAVEGGAIHAIDSQLKLNNIKLNDNFANYQGGGITFLNGIKTEPYSLHIVNSTFTNNIAHFLNGAVLLLYDANNVLIEDSVFTYNRAYNGGGGVAFWRQYPPILESNTYTNNMAKFGEIKATPPQILSIINYPKILQTSGEKITSPIIIHIIDSEMNLVKSDNSTFVSLEVVSTPFRISGQIVVEAKEGIAEFVDTSIQYQPGQALTLQFSFIYDRITYKSDVISLSMRQCNDNERLQYVGGVALCEEITCAFGQYVANAQCFQCPVGCQCTGSSVIESTKDYWIYRNDDGTVTSVPCSLGRCLAASECTNFGINTTIHSCCGPNREKAVDNPLCGKCLDDYIEWGTKCIYCVDYNGGLIFLLIVLSMFTLGVFHIAAQSSNGLTKIFLYHVQMLVVFFASVETSWIRWLDIFNFNILGASRVDVCIAPLSPAGQITMGIIAPLFVLAELGVVFSIHLTYWFLKYHRTCPIRGKSHKFHKSPYIRTLFGLFLFSYNSVSSSVFAWFKCVDVGETDSVTAEYPGLSCNSDTYKNLAGVMYTALILVVILIPICTLVIVRWMYLHSKLIRTKRHKLRERFGILYECYKPNMWFWEIFVLTRRSILILLSAVLVNDRDTMYMAISVTNVIILLIHTYVQPYLIEKENVLESMSLCLLTIVTLILGDTSSPFTPSENIALLLIIYIPLGFFILLLARHYASTGIKYVKTGAKKIREYVETSRVRNPSVMEMTTMGHPSQYSYPSQSNINIDEGY